MREWIPVSVRADIATLSDVGHRRSSNQDASGVLRLRRGWLTLICDGMGGFAGGEVASRMTVAAVIAYFKQVPLPRGHALQGYLRDAVAWANRQVWEYAQQHEDLRRMGTTAVVVLCYRRWAYVAHVGDSRLYLLRDGCLLQVTKDHSMVQRMLDAGELSAEEAAGHPKANIISRVVGQFQDVEVECQPYPLRLAPGDRLLLCTDGLYRMVDEMDILYQLRDGKTPQDICNELVLLANQAGGRDNITVQVVDCQKSLLFCWWLAFVVFALCLLGLLFWGWWGTSLSRFPVFQTIASFFS